MTLENIAYPLILKDESGSLEFFDDVGSLIRELEVPDVLRNIYMIFDSSGRPGYLTVSRPPQSLFAKIDLDLPADAPTRLSELEYLLRDYLTLCGEIPNQTDDPKQLMQRARRASRSRH